MFIDAIYFTKSSFIINELNARHHQESKRSSVWITGIAAGPHLQPSHLSSLQGGNNIPTTRTDIS